jgi:hypothetical protein
LFVCASAHMFVQIENKRSYLSYLSYFSYLSYWASWVSETVEINTSKKEQKKLKSKDIVMSSQAVVQRWSQYSKFDLNFMSV